MTTQLEPAAVRSSPEPPRPSSSLRGLILLAVLVLLAAAIVLIRMNGGPGPAAGGAATALPQGETIRAPGSTDHAIGRSGESVISYRLPGVVVRGPRSQRHTMTDIAHLVQAAIPRVTAVWGSHWARHAVVEIPATEAELAKLSGDRGDLARIAAVTSAEISSRRGRQALSDDRIVINPRVWPTLDRTGARVVLTHELTHVATGAVTGAATPRWLVEGFADYVGFRGSGLALRAVARELERAVRTKGVPRRLPPDAAFDAGDPHLARAYELAWLACRYIAARAGQPALVRFYRLVGRAGAGPKAVLRRALRVVLDLTPSEFRQGWRRYVEARLT
ncbi:MAG TPA: hypothetical protein VME70_02070 [Mycobacteriales bacterium]|nr:hypothetical protein [Mycobacteriales bacterium]